MKKSAFRLIVGVLALVALTLLCNAQSSSPPSDDPVVSVDHNPLFVPVEFQGMVLTHDSENRPELVWTTATEHNNKYFIVEKSDDGKYWTEASVIPGSGTSLMHHKYNFTDYSKITGPLYYKLSQYDYDGRSAQLSIIRTGFDDYTNLYGYQLYGQILHQYDLNPGGTVHMRAVVTTHRTYKLYTP